MIYGQAAVTNAAGQVAGETAGELTKLIAVVLTKIPLWIAAVIVIVMGVLFAKMARKIIENKLAEKGIDEEHQEVQILGGRLAYSLVMVMGVTVGLKIAGIDLTTIIAAVAFGIGFALKDLIMNFLAGIMILVSRHFTIGDFIKVGSTIGKVVEIQARVTVLQAIDGTKVIVPNADLFKKQVTSFTSNPMRRIELKVGVDYRNNLENAMKIALKTTKDTKGIQLEPKPAVLVDTFADSGVVIKIRAWVDSKGGWVKIKSRLIQGIKQDFDAHGVRIPWPIRTVVNDSDLKLEEKILEDQEQEQSTPEPVPAAPATPIQPAPTQPVTAPQEVDDPQLKPLNENR